MSSNTLSATEEKASWAFNLFFDAITPMRFWSSAVAASASPSSLRAFYSLASVRVSVPGVSSTASWVESGESDASSVKCLESDWASESSNEWPWLVDDWLESLVVLVLNS